MPDGFASPGFAYGQKPEIASAWSLICYVLPKALLRMNLVPVHAQADRLSDAKVAGYHELMRAPGGRAARIERMRQPTA